MIRHNLTLKGVIIFMMVVMFFGFAACGKKGPPLPPENKAGRVAAPYDLKAALRGDDIRLAWKHEVDNETAALKPEFFEIFMAKKTVEDCEGCPFEFQPAGRVEAYMMEFFLPAEKGFKYYFRVRAIDSNNLMSPYSKTVKYETK